MNRKSPESLLPSERFVLDAYEAWQRLDAGQMSHLIGLATRLTPEVKRTIYTTMRTKIARESDSPTGFACFYTVIMGDTRKVGSR